MRDVEHAAVGDHHHRFAGVLAGDVLERRVYARRERLQTLAVVGQGKVRVARLEAAEVFRVAVLGLIEGQALEVPVVAFAQARVELRR